MLFIIVISFKTHKVKVQEIKTKTFSLKKKSEYIIYIGRMPLQNKKKRNYKKILSAKPWLLEEEGLLSGSAGR